MNKLYWVALMLLALAGCGGGEDDADTHGLTTQPVNCASVPERCR